jgi:hypothetical protein
MKIINLVLVMMMFSACNNETITLIPGPQGVAGNDGTPGLQGPPGTPGSATVLTVVSNSVAATTECGEEGGTWINFFLDVDHSGCISDGDTLLNSVLVCNHSYHAHH